MPAARPLAERFAEKVDRSAGADGCWPWLASLGKHGYGTIKADGVTALAHRVAYVLAFGEIPAGYQVDHVWTRGCRVKHCCNPAHLEAVTQAENLRRQYASGRTSDVVEMSRLAALRRTARANERRRNACSAREAA